MKDIKIEKLYEVIRILTIEIKALNNKEELMPIEDVCKLLGTSDKNLKNELPKLNLKPLQLKKSNGSKVGKMVFKRSEVYKLLENS
jgi:hypothetical protein